MDSTRDEQLLRVLREEPHGATVVYVTLQRTAEQVAAQLRTAGLPARHYHAGMAVDEREATQEWFLASTDGIFVGASAAGAVWAARNVCEEIDEGLVVCVLCDRGDRYLSSPLFAPEADRG